MLWDHTCKSRNRFCSVMAQANFPPFVLPNQPTQDSFLKLLQADPPGRLVFYLYQETWVLTAEAMSIHCIALITASFLEGGVSRFQYVNCEN